MRLDPYATLEAIQVCLTYDWWVDTDQHGDTLGEIQELVWDAIYDRRRYEPGCLVSPGEKGGV